LFNPSPARWDPDRENIWASIEWGVENDPVAAIQLSTDVPGGHWYGAEQYLALLQRALDRLEGGRVPSAAFPALSTPEAEIRDRQVAEARLKALHPVGFYTFARGDLDRARQIGDEALELSRALGDKRGMAEALLNLAMIAKARGDREAAWSFFGE